MGRYTSKIESREEKQKKLCPETCTTNHTILASIIVIDTPILL
jgi:hypothetical protein